MCNLEVHKIFSHTQGFATPPWVNLEGQGLQHVVLAPRWECSLAPWDFYCRISGNTNTGWWLTYPSEKYESQLGWLFPIYGKIKNVPNHQPEQTSLLINACWSSTSSSSPKESWSAACRSRGCKNKTCSSHRGSLPLQAPWAHLFTWLQPSNQLGHRYRQPHRKTAAKRQRMSGYLWRLVDACRIASQDVPWLIITQNLVTKISYYIILYVYSIHTNR